MSRDHDPAFEAWADEARKFTVYEAYQKLCATPLRKTTEGFVGPCPKCKDGDDRFSINLSKNLFNCRKCDLKGNDSIAFVERLKDVTFIVAVEELTGDRPPEKDGKDRPSADPEVARDRADTQRAERYAKEESERQAVDAKRKRNLDFFNGLKPFAGSLAEKYLRSRKIILEKDFQTDLRFCPGVAYKGYANAEAKEETDLGIYPAMIAAIRNRVGELIGLHCTYLNEEGTKLKPIGLLKTFKAKKVWGVQQGGHICLGPIKPIMGMGEGIESTASWYQLGIGPDDVGIIVGINLGNISGGSTAMANHPSYKGDRNHLIQNGEPDQDKRAIALPDGIEHVILLGDGDSDYHDTRAKILTAGRRQRGEGKTVSVNFAPDGKDFNNLLQEVA